jgi:alkenylglycerophosphocholine hydrolase
MDGARWAGWAALAGAYVLWLAGPRPLPSTWAWAPKAAPILFLAAQTHTRTHAGAGTGATTAGLLFSAVGDVLLALEPPTTWFLPGLVAFLLAHVAYSVAFAQRARAASLWLAVPVAAVAAGYYGWVLRPALPAALAWAVPAYVSVIVFMVWRAAAAAVVGDGVGRRAHAAAGQWGLAGAILFFLSDAVLAYNAFVAPLAWGRLATMVLYYTGQAALAHAALLYA